MPFHNSFLMRAAVAALATTASHAHAVDYVFSHTGFAGGATISGTFSTASVDVKNDGVFSVEDGDITALEMRFSGSNDVAAFTANMLTDTVALTFRPSTAAATFNVYTGTIWPAPFSWDSSSDGTASPYFYSRVFGNTGRNASYTDRATGGNWVLTAAPVPEPAGGALVLAGGLSLLLWQRRRSA